MNTLPKFRIWDKNEKKMYYLNNVFIGVGQLGFSDTHYIDLTEDDNEDVEIMQWAGLCDLHNKEIWQGDIVKCRFMIDYDLFAEPKYVAVTFEEGKFLPMAKMKMTQYRMLPYYYDYEVVGNVYENSQLLGEKQKTSVR